MEFPVAGLLDEEEPAPAAGLLAEPPTLGLHSYGDAARLVWGVLRDAGLVGHPFDETPLGRLAATRGLPIDDPRALRATADVAMGFLAGPRPVPGSVARAVEARRGLDALGRAAKGRGDVLGAMEHPDLGPISFRWGDRNGGLAHILEKHGDEALREVPRIIAAGRLGRPYKTPAGRDRVDVFLGERKVVLAPTHGDEPGYWVVSSFKLK